MTAPKAGVAICSLLAWVVLAPIYARQPHALVGNVVKPFTGLAALFPLAYAAHLARGVPGLPRVGQSTLAVYCVEGIVGWKYFQLISPANAVTAAFWSLVLVLVVHGTRMGVKSGVRMLGGVVAEG